MICCLQQWRPTQFQCYEDSGSFDLKIRSRFVGGASSNFGAKLLKRPLLIVLTTFSFHKKRFAVFLKRSGSEKLVCLVGDKQSRINRFHAGWTSKAPHQPVVDAVRVIGVHTWQVSHLVSDHKLYHTNDTFSVLFASVVDACG